MSPKHKDAKKYRNAGRGKIPGRVDIDERPKTVENRARVGHWEGDLINWPGGTGHLATRVERMTRFTLAASRRPLRGRLRPSSRAGLAFGAHQAKPSAEARYALCWPN